MKLNPTKCSFGMSSGKFLGYMVSHKGIEASPEQVKAITRLKSTQCVKDVQRLTGRLAALNRFISRSSDKCKPFFDILRKSKNFKCGGGARARFPRNKVVSIQPPNLD